MFFPSLRAHLTQALPTSIQQKLGLSAPQGQNAPGDATGVTTQQATSSPQLVSPDVYNQSPGGNDTAQQPDNPTLFSMPARLKQLISAKWAARQSSQQATEPSSGYPAGQFPQSSPSSQFSQLAGEGQIAHPNELAQPGQATAKSLSSTIGSKLGRLIRRKSHPQSSSWEFNPQAQVSMGQLPEGLQQGRPENPNGAPSSHPSVGGTTEGKPGNTSGADGAQPQGQSQGQTVGGLKRMEAPPEWKPGNGVVESGPWSKKIEPLTVDQLFERKAKGIFTKTPKYSLTPDQIRVNYIRKQQEELEKLVFSMQWNDDDAINPFSDRVPTE